MKGLMQDWPLTCHAIIDHASRVHGTTEIVSRSAEAGQLRRTNYQQIRSDALRIAKNLQALGINPADRVATMAWNSERHMAAWYGIMGAGAVYHTLNPRLFPKQISWIVNEADSRVLFADTTFVGVIADMLPDCPTISRIVLMCDEADMPETPFDATSWEAFLAEQDEDFRWVEVGENDASGLCFTSGTTGNPKGVLYSHRSNVLHGFISALPDAFGLSANETIMPVVPMFHANAWGIAHAAPMTGNRIVNPGPGMDGAALFDLLDGEKVSITAAVPTVWLGLLEYLEKTQQKLPHLKRVVIGGSACPGSMIEKFETVYDVEVVHAWGMTELSPVGALAAVKGTVPEEERSAKKHKQGFAPFGVEMKVTDDDNNELPWDGKAFGRLKVRGPAVAGAYLNGVGADAFDESGFFDTGDVAHIDSDGFMQITDRAKDVIKSGGEWISSIELENLAMGHPCVAEAAVIGMPHPKWDERPLLVVVKADGATATREELLGFFDGKIAKWWVPDDVVFVDEIPHTATGKTSKLELRKRFADFAFAVA